MQSGYEGPDPPDVEAVVTVTEATEADLAEMGGVGKGSLAASALVLAGKLDDPRTSATAASMCAKALADVMSDLRELAPPKAEETELDRVRNRRRARIAAADAAASS